MRVDQMVRRDNTDKKKYESNAHLLGGITSSNRAFQDSNKDLLANKKILPATREYLDFFCKTLGENLHPKVEATIERAFENYLSGKKTLIFCERLGTQKEILDELKKIIETKIFPNGGLKKAKEDRERILKNYNLIELYWSRSFLEMQVPDMRKVLIEKAHNRSQVLRATLDVAERVGGLKNDRQVMKLLDLTLLRELSDQIKPKPGIALSKIYSLLDSVNEYALRLYLRLPKGGDSIDEKDGDSIDEDEKLNERILNFQISITESEIGEIIKGPTIWLTGGKDSSVFHEYLWRLLDSEISQSEDKDVSLDVIAEMLLDLGQGLRKILLRRDFMPSIKQEAGELLSKAVIRALQLPGERNTWVRMHRFVKTLIEADGNVQRMSKQSSKRQSLWKGVFLKEDEILSYLNGTVASDTRVNRCAAFNSPLLPDILVCTAIGSEGIDLHRYCADIIHHDLPWNPAKLEQRTGRIDRVGSLAEIQYDKDHFRLNIGIPFLAHNYEKFQYELLLSRAQKFEILLGKPEFPTDVLDEDMVDDQGNETGVQECLDQEADNHSDHTICLPEDLLEYLKMDLSVNNNKH